MFNPTNIDEVSIQATHMEANKGKYVGDEIEEPHEFVEQLKGKGKSKKTTMVKKDEESKPTCSHYDKKGHDKKHCWKFHIELKPKWA
jgi:hypothetical protein